MGKVDYTRHVHYDITAAEQVVDAECASIGKDKPIWIPNRTRIIQQYAAARI